VKIEGSKVTDTFKKRDILGYFSFAALLLQ
jgi:hypothetical protein